MNQDRTEPQTVARSTMNDLTLDIHFGDGDATGIKLAPCPDGACAIHLLIPVPTGGMFTIGLPKNTAGELGFYLTRLAQGATILDLIGRH